MRHLLLLLLLIGVSSAQSKGVQATSEQVTIPSKALGESVRGVVHLPPGYEKDKDTRYPVIVFLHGAGRGNEGTWEQRGTNATVARLIEEKKLPPSIVVCPRARRMSFYINWKGQETERHGDFVSRELPAWIDGKYRTQKGRQYRALLGDSMGGFGALVNALRHKEVFGSVAALEPSIYPEDIKSLPGWMTSGRGGRGDMLTRIFGDPIDETWWLERNVFHIVKKAKPGAFDDLAIYYDVGHDDRFGLGEHCSAWHKVLKEHKVAHTFHLREGGHGREFFSDNVGHALEFVGHVFAGRKPVSTPAASSGN
jgi:S-formylglutathione hydrolase FrmB